MADTNKITYVSLERLGYYDQKLKTWVAAADDAVKSELQGLISAEETRAKAAELTNAQAAEAAQNAADTAQNEVDALEAYVGTFTASEGVDTVVKYIDAKTANIASDETVGAIDDRVKAIEADYLKAADKTELSNAITAEKERAEGIEGGLETRLAAVEADYLVEADKTELSNAIQAEKERAEAAEKANSDAIAVLNGSAIQEGSVAKQVADAVAGILDGAPEAYDTLNEIATWIAAHPDSVAAINAEIKANADAIDAIEALVGTLPEGETSANIVAYIQKLVKAEEDRAIAVENGLDSRLQAVESKFTGEGSVDSKIEDALTEAKGYTDELAEGAVADNAAAIEKLNGDATTEGSVAKAVADAKALIDADVDAVEGRVEALEAASATHALASDLTALAGRVTTAEGEIDTLQSEMDAVEELAAANKAAHEANAAAIALKAAQTDLNAVSDRVTALETWHANFVEATEDDINAMFA